MESPKSPQNDKHSERLRLSLDRLEPRLLLSGYGEGGPAPGWVAPEWFEVMPGVDAGDLLGQYGSTEMTWNGEDVAVLTDHWVVQFGEAALAGIESVADTVGLFPAGAITFELVEGLGLAGQVLMRTHEATVAEVVTWLEGAATISTYQPNFILQIQAVPDDPLYGNLWGLENVGQGGGVIDADIDAASAWDLSTGSADIVVGVIDTGVDYTHPDLANAAEVNGLEGVDDDLNGLIDDYGNIWVNELELYGTAGTDDDLNGFIDDVFGWDFFDNDADPMDEDSHGTHVSGTIGAIGDNARGVVGVNWTTSIMALRFLGPGGGSAAGAIGAINYATMMKLEFDDGVDDGTPGADVRLTNNSWGGGGFSQLVMDAIEASGDAGMLFMAAAGNFAFDNDVTPFYPASYDLDNIISVAATDQFDERAGFSHWGLVSVDLAAPGVATLSTVPGWTGQLYDHFQGTSMAAPHASGVAALAWAHNPDATLEQVRDAMFSGVDRLASLDGLVATGGRLNARATLERVVFDDPLVIERQAEVSSGVTVTVYDVQGRVDVGPADLQVAFRGTSVASMEVVGTGGGMGIIVEGATSVGQFKDNRRAGEPVSFLHTNSGISKIKMRTGFQGYVLNNVTIDGTVYGNDIDQDGISSDPIALLTGGPVGSVKITGLTIGDFYMGGADSKGNALTSLKTKRGDFVGGIGSSDGGVKTIKIGGDWEGRGVLEGGITKLQTTGGLSGTHWFAGGIKKGKIGDDYNAEVHVGADSGKLEFAGWFRGELLFEDGASVGYVRVRQSFQGNLFADGSVGAVWIDGGIGPQSYFRAGEAWGELRVTGGAFGELSSEARLIQLTAPEIGYVRLEGSTVVGVRILAGADLGDDWAIGGTGDNADTFGPGTIDHVSVDALNFGDCLFAAGFMPAGNGFVDMSNELFLFDSYFGRFDHTAQMINSLPSWEVGVGSYDVGDVLQIFGGSGSGPSRTVPVWSTI